MHWHTVSSCPGLSRLKLHSVFSLKVFSATNRLLMRLQLYFDWVAADSTSAAKGFRQTEWVVDLYRGNA